MTKQEKIREEMRPFTTSCSYCGSNNCPFEGNPSCANCDLNLDQALQYLHSQGVVIKKDRELPKFMLSYVRQLISKAGAKFGYAAFEAMPEEEKIEAVLTIFAEDVFEAGYVAVEPLIFEPKPYCDKQPIGLPKGCLEKGFCENCNLQPKLKSGEVKDEEKTV